LAGESRRGKYIRAMLKDEKKKRGGREKERRGLQFRVEGKKTAQKKEQGLKDGGGGFEERGRHL